MSNMVIVGPRVGLKTRYFTRLFVFACAIVSATVSAVAQLPVPRSWAIPQNALVVLDLGSGTILGATIGMNEDMARDALAANHFPDIRKIEYPKYFLLQSCLGVVLNFRGGQELNDIYTNSRTVTLSNGLKVGQSIKDFTALLGKPSAPRELPSGVGSEFVYTVGDFELGAICLHEKPDEVRALSLRKAGLR